MSQEDIAKAKFFEGLACLDRNDYANAEVSFRAALAAAPRNISVLNNLAVAQFQQNKLDDASATARAAIAIDAKNIDAHFVLANCQRSGRQYAAAAETLHRLLELNPAIAEAHNDLGFVLNQLGRFEEALSSIDKAIALQPNNPAASLNRGNALRGLKRYEAALESYDKTLALKPDVQGALVGRGNVYAELEDLDKALAAYDAALALNPALLEAWLGRGNVRAELKTYDEALVDYGRALTIDPKSDGAWYGCANVYAQTKRYDEALAAYDKALALNPRSADAFAGRANVCFDLKRYDDAIAAYDKALALNPDQANAGGFRLHARMQHCDWSGFAAECARIVTSIRRGVPSSAPFPLLAIPSSPADQLACARLFSAKIPRASVTSGRQDMRYRHDRIRIAYLSADFRDHPVTYLLAGVIEGHDRKRFDVSAMSFGSDSANDMRARMRKAFDRFVDVDGTGDGDVVKLMRELEIDIAVDLMGNTKEARGAIFANRAAPVQVNYLGFAGTMGADYIDYLVADPTLIPAVLKDCYAEKIAYLPYTYLPHDHGRLISSHPFKRAEFGLPPTGTVFCCFNNSYKLNPAVFDSWMTILKQVEGSVLWLSDPGAVAAANLKREAQSRGINPDRIVFARRMLSVADHLARHRLADLFLDTWPYNAHTTASDALWAGLPVLTHAGESFASRVAASLLNAIDMPELIAPTPQAYEQMAIELAMNPERLAQLRQKLAANRATSPLFDTKLYTRHLEAAYTAMHERHQAGLPPDHIHVPRS